MVETVEAKHVSLAASTLLFPELEFDVKPCGEYTREDFLSRDDDSLCLITNRPRTVDEAVPLAQAYRRRWGIETSYRKIGEFLPRTTPPVFAVRLFYFLFAVALYNLWIVVCLLLSE